MEIIRLPLGKQAPVDADCIRIEERDDGAVTLTGSALCSGEDDGESVSIVGGPTFGSRGEAEAAGLAWAQSVGVEQLYVGVATPSKPFEVTEMDRP